MKKVLFLISLYFIYPISAFAQNIGLPKSKVPAGVPFETSLGSVIANVLQIMFIVGILGGLVFIVWGSLDWITSGGDKEKLAGARKKIVTAIIGLTVMALSLFIISLVGEILGINNILNQGPLPKLNQAP